MKQKRQNNSVTDLKLVSVRYSLLLLNDDTTAREFVLQMLENGALRLSKAKAERIVAETEKNGESIVDVFSSKLLASMVKNECEIFVNKLNRKYNLPPLFRMGIREESE